MEVDLLHVSAVLAILGLLYHLLTRNNGYFHDKPIPSLAVWPLFGSTAPLLLKRYSFTDYIKNIYDKFAGAKVFGLFDTTTPFFVLRDPELIKQIGVKDFDHFVDHRPTFGDAGDADNPHGLFGKSLFAMNGQRWREMRAILSPAFTGSKMRQMFGLMTECAENTVSYYENQVKGGGSLEVEVKDMLTRLGMDVIASCAFGMKIDSIKDRDNEFVRQGQQMMQFGRLSVIIKMIAMRIFPKLMPKWGVDIIDREQAVYFTRIIQDTVRTRESQGIVRHDMVDLLLQARKGILEHQHEKEVHEGFATVQESEVGKAQVSKTMTETEMIAQCLIFFLAGFDTVSTIATFLMYELVRNPDIQERLYEEVQQMHESLGGKSITYDSLQKMKYLDMVVSETLRMWPAGGAIDRICVRDYTLDDGEGLKFTIEKGACVWFPVYGLHHDPQYFPDPSRFDPERFNDENKGNINLGAYIPFGIGPRNCIGSRFALMEVKSITYQLLVKFSLHKNENTQIPVQLKKGFTGLGAENGVHVQFQARKRN